MRRDGKYIDDIGTFDFAFASSSSALSIIGNIQQEVIQITFDFTNNFLRCLGSDEVALPRFSLVASDFLYSLLRPLIGGVDIESVKGQVLAKMALSDEVFDLIPNLQARAYYGGQEFGVAYLHMFTQQRKSTKMIYPAFYGHSQMPANSTAVEKFRREKGDDLTTSM
ncbi:hypothetical protein Taro_018532 [Colocasia esculenta]|uniref:Uncharacterized protein n=1 Tax=Colocasia esculenta TaxID=4460 RepID=A0A843UWK2_COLES|nr:hypothetical protein [Colocasia esculenta]